MAKRTCEIDGCDSPHKARGWCATHYRRWWDHGDPTQTAFVRVTGSTAERFYAKVDKQPDGCWLWTASCRVNGYGQFAVDGDVVYAHRWSYEHHVGPIPEGLEIDHLCFVRRCVNPDHLEPVTTEVNIRRAAARITHCPQGHPYDGDDLYVTSEGHRKCRACHRERARTAA